MAQHEEIIVGVDGSPSGRAAVDWAAHRAQRLHGRLHLVHVIPDCLVSPEPKGYGSVHEVLGNMLHSEVVRARRIAQTVDIRAGLELGERQH